MEAIEVFPWSERLRSDPKLFLPLLFQSEYLLAPEIDESKLHKFLKTLSKI